MKYTTMTIYYPNGSTQRIKPDAGWFEGDWYLLAETIARPHYPEGAKIKYVLN